MNERLPREFSRRLFLADQCLASGEGHHLFYNRALAEAALRAGYKPVVLSARAMDTRLLAPYQALATFGRDWRARPPRWALKDWRLLRILDKLSCWRFYRNLTGAFRTSAPCDGDLIFAQMITPRNLAAWARWFLRVETSPRLALHVAYDPSRYAAHSDYVRWWSMLVKSARARKVLALTDSEHLVEPYEMLLGCKVGLLPHVIASSIAVIPPPGVETKPVFGVLGNPRWDKGFCDSIEAILQISSRADPPQFIVQTARPDASSVPWVNKLESASLPNVEIVPDAMTDEAKYAALFSRITAFLLPYRLEVYGARTSGIFCEALASARIVLPTEGSWMSDKAGTEAACVRVPAASPRALADAIDVVNSNHLKLLGKAERGAACFRREFSAENFVGTLFAAADRL